MWHWAKRHSEELRRPSGHAVLTTDFSPEPNQRQVPVFASRICQARFLQGGSDAADPREELLAEVSFLIKLLAHAFIQAFSPNPKELRASVPVVIPEIDY